MALKDTDLITYGTLKSVVAKQNEVYDAKYVAKSSLTESPSGNLRIVANDKGYELLSTNSAINVNKLEGVIGVEHIPNAALERVIPVANQAARFQLTEREAQLGDVIKENDSGKMFFVTDLTNLGNANGYMEFAVGTAANVSWENVSGKPDVSEVGHTHSGSDITSAVDNATNAVNATNASNVPWTGVSNKPALAASLSISGSTLALKDSEGVSMSSVTLPEASGSGSSAEIDFSDFRSDVEDFQNQMETVRQAAINKEEEERTDEDWDAIFGTTDIVSGDDIRSALVKINWMLWERPSNNEMNEIYRPVNPDELKYNMFNIGNAPEDGHGIAENWIIDLQALKAFREVYDSLVVTREGFAKDYVSNTTWMEGAAYNLKYRITDRYYNDKSGEWVEATYVNVLTDMSPLDATKLIGTIPVENLPQEALSSGGSSSAATLSPAGSEYQPVYINNSGVPTACGFKIMQVSSLPANPDQDTLYIVTGA